MKLGKVKGKVWTNTKVDELEHCRFLIVQPLLENGEEVGKELICADPKQIAGPDDKIVYVTGTDATQGIESGFAPINACVVELVDSID